MGDKFEEVRVVQRFPWDNERLVRIAQGYGSSSWIDCVDQGREAAEPPSGARIHTAGIKRPHLTFSERHKSRLHGVRLLGVAGVEPETGHDQGATSGEAPSRRCCGQMRAGSVKRSGHGVTDGLMPGVTVGVTVGFAGIFLLASVYPA